MSQSVIYPANFPVFRPLSSVKAASIPPGKGMLADFTLLSGLDAKRIAGQITGLSDLLVRFISTMYNNPNMVMMNYAY